MGFEILPPDVNASQPEFSVETKDGKECIRFALEAIKSAGSEGCKSIVAEREKDGPYKSLDELCSRIDIFQANKKTIESLTKAGALDSLLPDKDPKEARAILLAGIDQAVDTAHLVAKEKQTNNTASLFGDDFGAMLSVKQPQTKQRVHPLTQSELLNFEKEVLGLYFSGHPMAKYQEHLAQLHATPIRDILDGKATGNLNVLGIITLFKKRQNKQKKEWAQFVIEDCTGSLPVNAFARTFEEFGHKLGPNAILNFSGKINVDDESARCELTLQSVGSVTDVLATAAKEFIVELPPKYTKDQLQKLSTYLDMTKGTTQVFLEVPTKADPTKKLLVRTHKSIFLHRALLEFIENTLGTSWRFK